MPNELKDTGWKAFFAILMILQSIVGFLAVQTYFTVVETRDSVKEVKQRQEEVILPRLQSLESRLHILPLNTQP